MADDNRHNGGFRPDGTKKGNGFLGRLDRADGRVSTELSVSAGIDGEEILFPLLVPSLDDREIDFLLKNEVDPKNLPESIFRKAINHALERKKQGLSPFAD